MKLSCDRDAGEKTGLKDQEMWVRISAPLLKRRVTLENALDLSELD